MHAS
ncbi:uncharacterized protein FFE2_00024 [Fusarium fujikuroi]|jgi:Ca2+-binding EF-hand superfamily protein